MDMNIAQEPITIRLLQAAGDLTHNLQIERGYTALYVDSGGEIFADELRVQYRATDAAVDTLARTMELGSNTQTPATDKKLDAVHKNAEKLVGHRAQIQEGALEFAKAINIYTYTFIYPTIEFNIESALGVEDVNPTKVTAYSNFLQWKERAGRERAWGAHGFCSKVFKNREFTERMLTLIEEQSAYKRAFMSLATERQRHEVDESLGGYVMEVLDSIHRKLKDSKQAEDLEALSPINMVRIAHGQDRPYAPRRD